MRGTPGPIIFILRSVIRRMRRGFWAKRQNSFVPMPLDATRRPSKLKTGKLNKSFARRQKIGASWLKKRRLADYELANPEHNCF